MRSRMVHLPSFGVVLLGSVAAFASIASALIPATPSEQTRRAITSIRESISRAQASSQPDGRAVRLYIDYLLPLPAATSDADIDPWPGGLAQMYPYAEETLRDILLGVVADDESEVAPDGARCSSQLVSAPDCSGLFIQESPVSASRDVAALLFPGPDQLDDMKRIDDMVGPDRTLLLFNRQFVRAADFGFFKRRGEAQKSIIDRYDCGFAFQELACRGEDVKLTFERRLGWQSCLVDENGVEMELLNPSKERPDYADLEAKINEVLPEPLWLRMIGEAQEKGLKFQRKD